MSIKTLKGKTMNFSNISKFLVLALCAMAVTSNTFAAQKSEQKTNLCKKVVLWDLGYVLLKHNQLKMTSYILPRTCGLNPWNLVRLGMLAKYGCFSSDAIQATMDNVLHNA